MNQNVNKSLQRLSESQVLWHFCIFEPPLKKLSNSKSKPKRPSKIEASELIVKNNIHPSRELYAVAEERNKEGQTDLAAFVLLCTKKSLNDLIEGTCEMPNAKGTLEREKTSRMQVLEKVRLSSCVDGCDMELCTCLRDILQKNGINSYAYADTIRDVLIHALGKFRNVMITGPANCGKTFLLKPLEIITGTLSSAVLTRAENSSKSSSSISISKVSSCNFEVKSIFDWV